MLTVFALKNPSAFKRMPLTLFICLCLLCGGFSHTAFAHKLFMFTSVEGAFVHGRVYFSASVPLRGGEILIKNDKGEQLAALKSDEAGKFTLPVAKVYSANRSGNEGKIRIICQTIDGHKAERVIELAGIKLAETGKARESRQLSRPVRPLSDDTLLIKSGEISKDDIRQAIAAELRPFKEQIDLLSSKIWLRDILGGIGFMFGIFGLWMFIVSNRRLGEARRINKPGSSRTVGDPHRQGIQSNGPGCKL